MRHLRSQTGLHRSVSGNAAHSRASRFMAKANPLITARRRTLQADPLITARRRTLLADPLITARRRTLLADLLITARRRTLLADLLITARRRTLQADLLITARRRSVLVITSHIPPLGTRHTMPPLPLAARTAEAAVSVARTSGMASVAEARAAASAADKGVAASAVGTGVAASAAGTGGTASVVQATAALTTSGTPEPAFMVAGKSGWMTNTLHRRDPMAHPFAFGAFHRIPINNMNYLGRGGLAPDKRNADPKHRLHPPWSIHGNPFVRCEPLF